MSARSDERAPRGAPLSAAQQRLWFLDRMEPGRPIYNIAYAARLAGPLPVDALRRALDLVVARHDALRTVFPERDGVPEQRVLPAAPVPLPVTDVPGRAAADRLVHAEAALPFDLGRGPLLRARLLRLAPEEHVLLLSVHHIVFDAWSESVFVRELGAAYEAFARGEEPALPAPPPPYTEVVRRQVAAHGSEETAASVAWWRSQLAGAPALLALPTDRPRPAVQTYRGATVPVRLDAPLLASLKALAAAERVSVFMAILAAFDVVLGRWSGQEDVSVGVPVAGRTIPESEAVIGLFVNTMVLRADLSGNPTFRELLARTRDVALSAYEHQDVPLEKLVEELAPGRSLAHAPLFQVMLAVQNIRGLGLRLPGLAVERLRPEQGTSRFDLTLFLNETPGELAGSLEYATDLFERATAERFVAQLLLVLRRMTLCPDERVQETPLLDDAGRLTVLERWSRGPETAVAETVVERIVRRLDEAPDAVAVQSGSVSLTAGALQERSDRIAAALRARGAGRDVPVGIALERSADMVAAVLGVLKAGSAYVPLDPSYPGERLAYMLADSSAPVLLTERALAGLFPAGAARPLLLEEALASPPARFAPPAPADLAYLIYTSGSTGRPKGVELAHRGLANVVAHFAELLGSGPGDVLVSVTTLSFDIATLELLLPLASGARLVVASREEAREGAALAELLARSGASLFQATPATYRLLLESGWKGSSRLTCVCGGEILARDLAERVLPRCRALYNGYGPTETTIYSAVEKVESGAGGVPIGRPLANTTLYLLDVHGAPVPPGIAGEIWIGGLGVARGYRGRPDLTDERFLPSPFVPGERLYRTGDRARFLADGRLEVLGRLDRQVKLRGFRIEPGEIEAALATHPAVSACAVAVKGEGDDRRLVAYVVPSAGASPRSGELRQHLARVLPEYMLPSLTVTLDALPMTPNRKVDRAALPEPTPAAEPPASRPAADATEERLVAIYRDVLGRASVGAEDDFFALGGHSLLAVPLFARIEKAFGRKLPLATVFTAPTPAALARVVRGLAPGSHGDAWSPLVPIQPLGPRAPLFCFHAVGGNVLTYFDLSRRLGPEQPVWGVQARGLDGRERPHESVEEMAACYVEEIRRAFPEGPYHLSGSSFGGLVAYETARQLRAAGAEVGVLALFDTIGPDYLNGALAIDARRLRWMRFRQRVDLHVGNFLASAGPRAKWEYLATKVGRLARDARKLGRRLAARAGQLLRPLPSELRRVEAKSWNAMYAYVAGPYAGRITLFRASKQPAGFLPDPHLGWSRVAVGGIEVHEVEGYHGAIVYEPRVGPLAVRLAETLARSAANRRDPSLGERAS